MPDAQPVLVTGAAGFIGFHLSKALLEAGRPVHLGVVPGIDPDPWPAETPTTEKVLRLLDMLGLEPSTVPSLVVTPACGLAGAGPGWAREALRLVRTVASNLSA